MSGQSRKSRLLPVRMFPPVSDTAPVGAPPAGLESLRTQRSRWPAAIGAALTVLMAVGLARQLFASGLAGLTRMAPVSPWFYLSFALLYMSPPTGDFLIFRRLWGIPADGLVALLKKRIANEVVFGYSGEAYFYAWARARAALVAAPFGAVKDVSILSAIAGNTITLGMIAVALPLGRGLLTPEQFRTGVLSTALLLAISLPFLVFSRRVFSLPRRSLWEVFGIHCARLLFGSTLIAVAWHFALPWVPLGVWLFLAAGRLLVSRLPLVPNKDLLFASFAIMLIGGDRALTDLIAFTAALALATHVALIVAFGVWGVITWRRPW